MSPLAIVIAFFAFLALVFVLLSAGAVRRRRRGAGLLHLLVAALMTSLAALTGAVAIGMQGYRALTREVVAATVDVSRAGPRAFDATFHYPEGGSQSFRIEGDELYVDAHILKWHPVANMLGLHTGFALDRVAGRYAELEDEASLPRTVYRLGDPHPLDPFPVVRRYRFLEPLVDAEYGSGSFVPLREAERLEVRVSTTGLLIRSAR